MKPDGLTHWDIAAVGVICHPECAVAQLRSAKRFIELIDHLYLHATQQPDGYWQIPGNEWDAAWANWREAGTK